MRQPAVDKLRTLIPKRPRAVLRDPSLAQLAKKEPLVHAELQALAEEELESRALFRDLKKASRRTRQLFLCDYSLSLIHLFQDEGEYPFNPELPRRALVTARQYALGKVSAKQFQAANDAAWKEWCRVCPVALAAPWDCFAAVRASSAWATWAETKVLGFYRPHHIVRGVAMPIRQTAHAIAEWKERREQRALLQAITTR